MVRVMKKFSFQVMAQLAASAALTLMLSQPAFANGGCPGGGGGYRPPSPSTPVGPPTVRPTTPPSTFIPGKPPGPGNIPPPPTATRGLTVEERARLVGQKSYLIDLIGKINNEMGRLVNENKSLTEEINELDGKIQNAKQGFPGYNLSDLLVTRRQKIQKKDRNFAQIDRYIGSRGAKQREVDAISRQLKSN